MSRILVPLADGCEEIEAVTLIDVLRRSALTVVSAGLRPGIVRCSRGVNLVPDVLLDDVIHESFDMIALPGGMPGAQHLRDDPRIISLVEQMAGEGKWIAAICAAPMVLHAAGLLEGRQATSFPGVLDKLPGTHRYLDEAVVVDHRIVTSRGPGTAMDFALTLVEMLSGPEQRKTVEGPLQR